MKTEIEEPDFVLRFSQTCNLNEVNVLSQSYLGKGKNFAEKLACTRFLICSFQILCRFTFKVTLKIDDCSDMLLEGLGAPRTSKKAAAEHAAEGALWYLEKAGYIEKSG